MRKLFQLLWRIAHSEEVPVTINPETDIGQQQTSLEKLAELTRALPPPYMKSARVQDHTEYAMEAGRCVGFGLLKNTAVAVQIAFLPNGSEFPVHMHANEQEALIVVAGQLEVRRGDRSQVLATRDLVVLAPGDLHSCHALEDSWVLGITIPASEGYPDVG
jgi:quercetin dioxygenase-like cupin family protein